MVPTLVELDGSGTGVEGAKIVGSTPLDDLWILSGVSDIGLQFTPLRYF